MKLFSLEEFQQDLIGRWVEGVKRRTLLVMKFNLCRLFPHLLELLLQDETPVVYKSRGRQSGWRLKPIQPPSVTLFSLTGSWRGLEPIHCLWVDTGQVGSSYQGANIKTTLTCTSEVLSESPTQPSPECMFTVLPAKSVNTLVTLL